MTFDDFLQKLHQFFKNGGRYEPSSDDPEDYPRSVEITETDLLMAIQSIEAKMQKIDRKVSELKVDYAECEAMRGRLFLALEDKYTQIRAPHDEGQRWCYWQNRYFYVSWDKDVKKKGKEELT